MRFLIQPPENTKFNISSEGGAAVLAPDGHAFSFSTLDTNEQSLLWVQTVGNVSAKPLAGTEGATCLQILIFDIHYSRIGEQRWLSGDPNFK
jgi:hypothetical protein